MAQIANPLEIKTSPEFTFGKMLAVGVAKSVSEKALARTPVGNGTFRSGLIKLALAYAAYSTTKGKSGIVASTGQVLSTAWTVDGTEDLIAAAMARWGARSNGTSSNATGTQVPAEQMVI